MDIYDLQKLQLDNLYFVLVSKIHILISNHHCIKTTIAGGIVKMCSELEKTVLKMFENAGIDSVTEEVYGTLLNDHQSKYLKYLNRKEQIHHFENYQKGLLSDINKKNMEEISLIFENTNSVRNMSNFMVNHKFDDSGMLKCYQSDVSNVLSDPEGMITGDGCDFPKHGKHSVGVDRQYCGSLGKTDNCQSGVFIGYCSERGRALIDAKLYMPKTWFTKEPSELIEKYRVPENLQFKTKPQILSQMINSAINSGLFPCKYIGVDSAFGRDHVFLDSLPKDKIYFADVPKNYRVFASRPETVTPDYCGKGRPPSPTLSLEPSSVEQIVNNSIIPWEEWVIGNGENGVVIVKDKCIKVVELRDGKPRNDIWLYAREMEMEIEIENDKGKNTAKGKSQGKAKKTKKVKVKTIKYALCNESIDASPSQVRVPALMRWSIELCFRDCKDQLGMDQYQLRTWTGWRRHILFVLIAHLFTTKLKIQFSIIPETAEYGPYIIKPVTKSEYCDALFQLREHKEISNQNIKIYHTKPQSLLTIGLIRIWIQKFIIRTGNILIAIAYRKAKALAAKRSRQNKQCTRLIKSFLFST